MDLQARSQVPIIQRQGKPDKRILKEINRFSCKVVWFLIIMRENPNSKSQGFSASHKKLAQLQRVTTG
jgi:hypothetical protein